MCALQRNQLYPGIMFNQISDSRFKTNKISVHMITPLNRDTAAANALIPSLLRKGYEGMNDFTAFNQYLNELYGAKVNFGIEKLGDHQILSLSIVGVDDRYTLENDPLTQKLSEVLFHLLLHPPFEQNMFAESEVAVERSMLADAIQAQINDKRSYALNTAMRLMCAQEPFGVGELGTVEQAIKLTAKQVTQAYRQLLNTAQIEIMFVGCGNAATCLEIAKDQFKSIRRTEDAVIQINPTVHHVPKNTMLHTERMEVSQSKMVLGFSSAISPAEQEIFALRMVCMILGGTPTSKLFVNVRERLSLCYYCAATLEKSKGIVRVDCGVEGQNIEQAKREILHQLAEIQQGNISHSEHKDALLSLTNTLQTVGDSLHAIEGYYLAQILNGTSYTPTDEVEQIQAVTQQDMIAVSKKLHLDIVYILTNNQQVISTEHYMEEPTLWKKH